MVDAVREQPTATANFINQLAQGGLENMVGGGVLAQVPQPPVDPNRSWHEFKKNQLPSFTGGPNPAQAHYWLQEMEKIFDVAICTEKQTVIFSTHFLEEKVNNWYRSAKDGMLAMGTPMTRYNF